MSAISAAFPAQSQGSRPKFRPAKVNFLNPKLGSPGSKNPNAKLNDDLVREIRRRYDGDKTNPGERPSDIAADLGLNVQTVRNVCTRKAWKHVRDAACGDCHWFTRCSWLVSAEPGRAQCDWIPSRFVHSERSQEDLVLFLAARSHDSSWAAKIDLRNALVLGARL